MTKEKNFYILLMELLKEKAKKELPHCEIKVRELLERNDETRHLIELCNGKQVYSEEMEQLYNDYRHGYSVELLTSNFIGRAKMEYQLGKGASSKMRNTILNTVVCQIVDQEKNEKLLERAFSTSMLFNLRVVYRIDDPAKTQLFVEKGDLEKYSINEAELLCSAFRNNFGNDIDVFDIVLLLPDGPALKDGEKILFERIHESESGSEVMLTNGWLETEAEMLGDKFCIVPFTNKGILLHNLADSDNRTKHLLKLAKKHVKINICPGAMEDLTDSIYEYNAKTKRFGKCQYYQY